VGSLKRENKMLVSVASGKGGTGKTLVATSLALSLENEYTVQLLDCDVEEPNDHIFIKPYITHIEAVSTPVPMVDKERCTLCSKCAEVCAFHAIAVMAKNVLTYSEMCHGCGACSYLCPEKAITEVPYEIGIIESGKAKHTDFGQGKLSIGQAMAPPVIRKVKRLAEKDRVIIIDTSPGTSCPVVEAIKNSDFCLLVTEPTPFGLNDLILAVGMVRELGIPFGVVLNRAGIGDNSTQDYCAKENIPVLLTIPFDREIAKLYSQGISPVEDMPEYREIFRELFKKIEQGI